MNIEHIAEGVENRNAKNLLAMGLTPEQISQATGLSEEEVAGLKAQ